MKIRTRLALLIVFVLLLLLACNLPTLPIQVIGQEENAVSPEIPVPPSLQEVAPATANLLEGYVPGMLINPNEIPYYLPPLDCDSPRDQREKEACDGYTGVYDGQGTKYELNPDGTVKSFALSPPNNLMDAISLLAEENYLNALLGMLQYRDPRLGFDECEDASIYGQVIPLSYLVNMAFVEDGAAAGVIISAQELDESLLRFGLRYNTSVDLNVTEMEIVALAGSSWMKREIRICHWGQFDALIYGNVQDFFDSLARYTAPPGLNT